MGYNAYRTDPKLEVEGVWMDYGMGFRLRLARAGGANQRYLKLMEDKLKPIRRAVETRTLPKAKGDEIAMEVFVRTVILEWEIEQKDEKTGKTKWVPGVEHPDTAEIMKPGPESYETVLRHPELQELYQQIIRDATEATIFLKDAREIEAKNS